METIILSLLDQSILLGLDESGIYDTLEDIIETYKEGIANE